MANPSSLSKHHEKIAKEAHRLAHKAAADKGMKLIREPRHGEGRIFPGTIASLIWAASSSIGGDELLDGDVDVIRRYLKVTHNIVALERIEGVTHRFRIFVSEQWREPELKQTQPRPEPDAISKRAEKLTPQEAGEDRKPEPVVVRSVDDMSENRVQMLLLIDSEGSILSDNGRVNKKIRDLQAEHGLIEMSVNQVSDALRDFADYGWIKRVTKHKRTYAVEITNRGHERAKMYRVRLEPEKPSDGLGRSKVTVSDEYQERVNREVEEQRIQELADEAERGYEPEQLKERPVSADRASGVDMIAQHLSIYIEHEISRRMKEVKDPRIDQVRDILYSNLPPFQMLAEIDQVVRSGDE